MDKILCNVAHTVLSLRSRKYQIDVKRNKVNLKETLLNKLIEEKQPISAESWYTWIDDGGEVRVLSKKAQEMKIFIENNPIPKEFLKS